MKLIRLPILVAAALAAFTMPLHAQPDGSNLIAKMGSKDIPLAEIQTALGRLSAEERTAIDQNPSLLNQAVRAMLLQKAVMEKAVAEGYDKKPDIVAQLERVREAALVESYLQSVSKVPEDYPSEAEIKAAYDANLKALVVPKQIQMAQIYIAVPQDAGAEANQKARTRVEDVVAKLKAKDADFGGIARRSSDEPTSAGRDGEIGWLTEAQIQPEIRECTAKLKKGEISEPVRLSDGWHILKCLDVKESYVAGLEEVRQGLVSRLRAERARANREQYVAGMLRENPLAINEIAMAQLLKDSKKK